MKKTGAHDRMTSFKNLEFFPVDWDCGSLSLKYNQDLTGASKKEQENSFGSI